MQKSAPDFAKESNPTREAQLFSFILSTTLKTGCEMLTEWQGVKKETSLAKLYCKYQSQKGIDQNWQRMQIQQ